MSSGVDTLARAAAHVPLWMALVVVAVGLVRLPASGAAAPGRLAASLGLALELLLAAGLLRLSAIDDLDLLAGVAAIVLVRRLLVGGLQASLRAQGARDGDDLPA